MFASKAHQPVRTNRDSHRFNIDSMTRKEATSTDVSDTKGSNNFTET